MYATLFLNTISLILLTAGSHQEPLAGPLPYCFGEGTESASGAEQGRARMVVADFLRKVLKLASLRLTDLCDRIDFSPLDRTDVLTQVIMGSCSRRVVKSLLCTFTTASATWKALCSLAYS